jgi:hypothetical protein
VFDDDLEDAPPLPIVKPRHLAGDAERRHAADADADEEVDDTTKTIRVQISVGMKRGGEN